MNEFIATFIFGLVAFAALAFLAAAVIEEMLSDSGAEQIKALVA